MDEVRQLQQRLQQERPVPWGELPDLALYMDQIISYMPRRCPVSGGRGVDLRHGE